MSASNTRKDEKKKRLGSRRYVAKQNNALEVEFNTDRTSASRPHVPEERNAEIQKEKNTESLSLFANPDKSPSEDQRPQSPEQFENKRKLGSSRKTKGRQRVQGSATESYHKPGEEVEEKNRGNEALATMHVSLTKQSERQAELGKREFEENATHNSSLYSAMPSEVDHTDLIGCPEAVLEGLPTSGNECKLMSDSCKSDEIILKVTHKSYTLQSKEVEKNSRLVDFSDITSLSVVSCPTVEQQNIDKLNSRKMPDNLLNMYSAVEKENPVEDEDTDLLWQDGNLHSNRLMSESYVESLKWFSANAGRTQNAELECSIILPFEDKSADKVQDEHVSTLLASQPQETDGSIDAQTDIDFNPIENKKLGYSCANEAEQHLSDSVTKSFHKMKEEVTEITRGNEVFETSKMSSLIQTVVQEKSLETDNRISQVKAAEDLVGNSELNGSFVHPSPSVNTQLINPQGVEDMLDEFPSTHAVKKIEHKNCNDPDLLTQQVNLQGNSLVSESPVTSENMESSMSAEIKTERKSTRDRHTHPHCSVEQSKWLLPKKEELTYREQTDHVNILKVKQAQHSTDNVTKVHEQAVISTQMQDLHDVDPFENTTCDNVENSVGDSGNLKDQSELEDTHQSQLIITESADSVLTVQKVLNPGKSEDEHLTKGSNVEVLHQIDDGHNSYNTKKPQTRGPKTVVIALEQVCDIKCQIEDDVKPKQTAHQEKDIFSESEDKTFSLQTLNTKEHPPFGSQADVDNMDNKNNTDLVPIGNTRKLGSSRMKKRRQNINSKNSAEHMEEIEGNITVSEVLENTSALQTTGQEELIQNTEHDIIISQTDDISLYSTPMPGYPSEVQKPINYSEADQEGLIHQSENLQEACDRETDFKVETFNESVAVTLEGIVKSQTLQSEVDLSTHEEQNEHFHLPKVRTAHHSEDAVNTELEQEIQPTQIQELQEIDYSSEDNSHDLTQSSDTCSGSQKDQSELVDTPHSELIVESTDNFNTVQDDSNPGDSQVENPTKESDVAILHQISAHHHPYDTMKTNIEGLERVVIALDQEFNNECQVEDDINPCAEQSSHEKKDGLFSEHEESKSFQVLDSESHTHLGSQPQDSSVNINEENNTDFTHIGNRRKLGSSRKKKGRHHVKESSAGHTEENEENITVTEVLETTTETSALQTMRPEELRQDTEQDIIISETDDISLYSTPMPGYPSEVQKPINYSKADQESLIHQSENLQEACDRETDFKVETFNESVAVTLEGIVKSQTLQSEVDLSTHEEQNEHFHLPKVRTAHHSEDAVNTELEQEIQPTQIQELQEIDYSSEDKTYDLTQSSDTCSGSQKDQSELVDTPHSELTVESTDNFITVQDDSNPGDSQVETPTKESDVAILHQISAHHHPYDTMKTNIEGLERVVIALDQEFNNECQVEDDINPCAEQSSHEKKDGLFSEHEESKSFQVLDSESHTHLGSQPQDSSVNINEENNTDFTHIGNRRKLGSSRKKKGRHHVKESSAGHTEENEENMTVSEVLETTTETSALQTMRPEELRQDTEQDIIITETDDISLYSTPMPGYPSEVQKPINYSKADQESLIHQSENLQEACDRETDFKVETFNESVAVTLEGIVKSQTLQSEVDLSTHEEQNEHFHLPEVRTAHHSEDAVNTELEQEIQPTQIQELQEIDYSSEDNSHDLTQSSDTCSGSQKDQSELVDTPHSELIVESTDNFNTVQDDSNPGDSQVENPTKESDVAILHQISAHHHPHDTMKPNIEGLERVVIALDQEFNNECQVEDDINPCAEQSSHEKKDALFSEHEESKSFQFLDSESHTHLGSQPQDSSVNINEENNTDFTHIGNRRKLGSSRKKKGRHHVKESSAGHTEENEENITVSEVFETTTETSALQTIRPEELRQDTEQDIIISETDDISLYSTPMPGYPSEVQKPINYSEADQESLIHQSENLQEACDRETDFKVETFNESVAVTLEGIVKSQNLQSEVDLSTHEEQNEHFHLPEVRTAHHSEDTVNTELEQEIQPTQIQELQEIDYSSEDKTHDLTQSSDTCSGSQKDQSELVDTPHSELIVESTDNFITVQDDSNPGDSQVETPTKESDVAILHQISAHHHPYDTMKTNIEGLERVVIALDQEFNNECQVEDDINPCAEQSSHEKKDGLFSEHEESKSFQVLDSESHTHLGSQPQDSSVNINEENNTDFTHIGNRRKLGSSRKKKGRRHVKESSAGHTEENEENITVTEVLETTTETSALQTMRPEELRQDTEQDIIISETDDISLYSTPMPGYPSEVQKPINYPEADQESLNHQSENLQEACDRETDFKVETFNESVAVTLEGIVKSQTLQSEVDLSTHEEQNEHFHLPKVRTAHHSEDAVNTEFEQEIQPTQIQELQEIDYSSEDKTYDLTQSSDTCSGSQKDQSELVDTPHSELTVESTDNFITVQDDSNPGDSQVETPTKESDVAILHQISAHHHPYDTMKPNIEGLERVVIALDQEFNNECQVEDDINPCAEQSSHEKKDALFSEHEESKSFQFLDSESHTHLGSQPQDSSVNINEENNTDFTHIGNRKKLGSSHKKKGRHHVKESSAGHTEKNEENITVTEVLETTTETSALQTMRPEELRQDTEQDIIISETDDISLCSTPMPGYPSEVQKPINYSEADQESLIHQSENLQEACDRETDFKVETFNESVAVTLEGIVKSQNLQSEVDLSTHEEKNEHFHLPEVRTAHHSEDAVNTELEQEIQPTQKQELQEIDYSSEDNSHDLTQSSDNCSGSQKDQSELVDTPHSELTVESTDNFITVQDDSNPGDSQVETPTKESDVAILHQISAHHHPYDTMKPNIEGLERVVIALDQEFNNECQVEDDINPCADQSSHEKKDGLFSEHEESKSFQVLDSESHTHLGSQPQDSSVNVNEENNTDFTHIGNRRKLGSSRKKKGRRHVKESSAGHTEENEENMTVTEVLETTTETSALQTMSPEELRQDTEQDIIITETDDISLYSSPMPGYPSEVQKPINYSEADQESLIHQSENLQEACDRETDFKVETFNESVAVTLEGIVKSQTLQSEVDLSTHEEQNEHFHLPEVRTAHHSEDAVNTEFEQEIQPTQIQELQEIDYSSEDNSHDLTQSSDTCSGSQKDQSELVDTPHSELIVESTDNFITVQDDSNPGDSQVENPTKESDVAILHQISTHHHPYDTMKTNIEGLERVVIALDQEFNNECQVEDDINPCAEQSSHEKKDGLFSEHEESKSFQFLDSESHTHLGSQPQDSSVNINEENNTDFTHIGNRKKLGSSRKKKGRHHVKESSAGHTEENEENMTVSEVFETTTETSALQTIRPEELRQDTEQDIIITETDDISLYSTPMPGYPSEVQNPINYSKADQESLIHQSENLQEACDRETDFKVETFNESVAVTLEGIVKSQNLQSEVDLSTHEEKNEHFHLPEVRTAHHSEDAVNTELEQEIQPTQIQELQEIDYSSEDKTHDLTQSSDTCSGSQKDQSELVDTPHSELIVESTDNFNTVQDDSNPGDSQVETPTKESDVAILHQISAHHHPYDTMKPNIEGLERVVIALDQEFNNECQVEDDINPCAEQSSHEKKDGLFSEHEESKSFQVLDSESHTHLGSQPQDSSVNINEENNTDFTHIGNRKKLGSSRKKKGRHHVKESSAGHTEENEENMTVSEVFETTTETSALQTMRPEELRQDTEQDIIITETDDISLYSTPMPGYPSEVQKPINYSKADQESLIHKSENLQEACDRETDFKVETFNESVAVTLEGIVKSQTLQSEVDLSTHEEQNEHFHLPEVRTAHHSEDAVNTELEQEIQPTQKQELQEIDYSSEDNSYDLTQSSDNCSGSQKDQSELVDTPHSELTVESTDNFITVQDDSNPGDSQVENPTKESDVAILHQISAHHHPYDTMKTNIEGLERVVIALDQEFNNECQVEDDINPCAEQSSHEKKDGLFSEHEESKSFQFLDSESHTHLGSQPQDSSVNINEENNTDFTHIGNRRKLGSSRKKKGRRHVKESSAGHTEENEENMTVTEVLETTTETSALQTMSPEELRQDTEQDIIITETDDISLYSSPMPGYPSEVQKPINYSEADQESLIHQSENLQEACDRETDFKVETFNESVAVTLEGIVKSQTLQSEVDLSTHEEQNEHFHLPEVRTAHHSEDAVNTEFEQEIQPTQIQELQEIDYSSEDNSHDLTQSSDTCSGSQKDESELVDTPHSELIVESTDNFITVQDDSNPGDSQVENPTKESDVAILHQISTHHHPYDTMKTNIEGLERVVIALDQEFNNECQVEDDINPCAEQSSHEKKDALFSEHEESKSFQFLDSESHTHLGSQPQDSSVNINEENNTDFTHIGNRKKLGSSRKKKGRHHVKESSAGHTEENEENITVTEVLETTTETSALQTIRPEELRQDTEQDIIITETDDISLYSTPMPGYPSEVQKPINYSKADQESLIHQSENLQEACDRETDFKVETFNESVAVTLEGIVKSQNLQSEVDLSTHEEKNEHFHLPEVRTAHHSEDAVNTELEQEIQPTQIQELQEIDYSSEDNSHDLTQSSDNCSGSQKDQSELVDTQKAKSTQMQEISQIYYSGVTHDGTKHSNIISVKSTCEVKIEDTHQSELSVKSTDDPAARQEVINSDKEDHPTESNTFKALDQMNVDYHAYDTKKPQTSELERADNVLNTVYENECQEENEIKSCAERKSHLEKDILSSKLESEYSLKALQSEMHALFDPQNQDNSVSIDEQHSAGFSCIGSKRKLGSSRRNKGSQHFKNSIAESHQKPTNQSNFTDLHDKKCPHVSSVTDTESKEREKDTELLMQWGILQASSLVSDLHSKSDNIGPRVTMEGTTEKHSPEEHTELKCIVEQPTVVSPYKVTTNEEQSDHFNLTEVRGVQNSETTAKKVHEEDIKSTQLQEMHQISYISDKEDKPSVQTLHLEVHVPLDSQPQDHCKSIEAQTETETGYKFTANKKKLGSSRRNKGRQHGLDSEKHHKCEEEVVETTCGDESSKTTKVSSSIETTRLEKLKLQTDPTVKSAEKITLVNEGETTKKVQEEDTTLSQNIIETTTMVSVDITRSDKDDFSLEFNEGEKKNHRNVMKNLTSLTDYGSVKMDLTPDASSLKDDSGFQRMSYPDDNVSCRSVISNVHCQEEAFHVQNTESLFCDKELLEQCDVGDSKKSAMFSAMDPHRSQQDVQEKTHLHSNENLEGKSTQRRRKVGSTRKLIRKPEEQVDDKTKQSNLDAEDDRIQFGITEVGEELPPIVTPRISKNERQLSLHSVFKEQQEERERNVGEEPSQLNDSAIHIPSVVAGRNRRSVNLLLSPSTEDAIKSDCIPVSFNEIAQNDEIIEEDIKVIQDQALKSQEAPGVAVPDLKKVKSVVREAAGETNAQASGQELYSTNQEAHNTNFEMKTASPNFSSPNRRRKLGSTRKLPGSQSKREDLCEKQEVNNEVTVPVVGDNLSGNASGVTEPQLHKKHEESIFEQRKEQSFERHSCESQVKPLDHPNVEESRVPLSREEVVETEHQVSPDDLSAEPSTSTKPNVMSESASGGRRRKMGSHRKSRGNPNCEDQVAGEDSIKEPEKGGDVRSMTEESGIKRINEHRDECLVLDTISEVGESDKKPSSNISSSRAGEPPRPVSQKVPTPVTQVTTHMARPLDSENQKKLSLVGESTGAAVGSKSFNVMMVGDTSVGKTSFMKRAQSGKFSLDLPASVGLDSCKWTVVVDGKPVLLHLWDTAGQERFHSITRQIFHKAQAFLLMYDITSPESFSAVSYWANCIQEGAVDDVTILLLGNKSDRADRQVKTQDGEILAKEYNFKFMECSAATGENVIQCLENMARMLSQKTDTTQEAMVLNKESQQKQRSGCC